MRKGAICHVVHRLSFTTALLTLRLRSRPSQTFIKQPTDRLQKRRMFLMRLRCFFFVCFNLSVLRNSILLDIEYITGICSHKNKIYLLVYLNDNFLMIRVSPISLQIVDRF